MMKPLGRTLLIQWESAMDRQRVIGKWVAVAVMMLLASVWTELAAAQALERSIAMPYQGRSAAVAVSVNKSQVLEFPRPVKILSIGNPDIADIVVVRSRQVYVLGKTLGTTNVVLWDQNERVQGMLNVTVTHDLDTLKLHLHDMLPDENIQVRSAQNSIVLSGEVSSAERMETALRLAQHFSAGDEGGAQVINLMQVGGAQQVMLEVKVAEVSRSLVKRLETDFNVFNVGSSALQLGAVKGGASFPDALFSGNGATGRAPALLSGSVVGPAVSEFAPTTATIEDAGIFASYLRDDYLLNLVLDAANREGVAKILAEPNLTTLTGQPAQFLAGGEFPIPVPQGDGQITIENKEFGVGLRFLPVVLNSGSINLKVDVSVSELTASNSLVVGVGEQSSSQFFVPALTKRSASSTVELATGQTIAIAGMLNESLQENISKFPGLGDVPVIGALFRSQEFVKEQTELVIFVTPRLARAYEPDLARLPTGSFVPPSDVEFYLMGRFNGRDEADQPKPRRANRSSMDMQLMSSRREGGTEGQFGHDL